jgi:dTDP-4-amino-4,6-dideoxygalactose transaminase
MSDTKKSETKPGGARIAAARPYFPEEDIAAITAGIADVLRGGRLILGPRAAAVEKAWADRLGVAHAVAVSSCTAALEIAYRHHGVAGREVIVPTNTFVATAVAALHAGARPVFCDIDPTDWCIDVDDALSRVTPRTAAIVVVHVSGFVASGIERLRRACRERRIPLVEDCAHAHGARLGDREAGSLGDAGCFSFYPTKVMTCAAGGLVTTDDAGLAALARSLRHHGQGESLEEIVRPGNDWVLDEVRAVMLAAQTARLEEMIARRTRIATRYAELLAGDPSITLSRPAAGSRPVWYKYPVVLPEGVDTARVRKRMLDEHAIEVGALYSPPAHLMPVFRNTLGTGPGMLPKAEAMLGRQITLPMHAWLELEDVDRSVAALRDVLRSG